MTMDNAREDSVIADVNNAADPGTATASLGTPKIANLTDTATKTRYVCKFLYFFFFECEPMMRVGAWRLSSHAHPIFFDVAL